ncbi:MAG: hypothetical protein SOW56_00880, partial [Bacteroidaceae bacterium]|nr:hypothetical protein [Bacteroidaceae bacterium]
MARKLYIDIDKAVGQGFLEDWYINSVNSEDEPLWTEEHLRELVNDFLLIPVDTPTANVAEVRRGKWIKTYHDEPLDGHYYCSCCNKGIDIATGKETPIDR